MVRQAHETMSTQAPTGARCEWPHLFVLDHNHGINIARKDYALFELHLRQQQRMGGDRSEVAAKPMPLPRQRQCQCRSLAAYCQCQRLSPMLLPSLVPVLVPAPMQCAPVIAGQCLPLPAPTAAYCSCLYQRLLP